VESLFEGLSFVELCVRHRGASCLADPSSLPHDAVPILQQLLTTGAPVLQTSPSWTFEELDAAVRRGAHRSTIDHRDFLREEFADMTAAGQWLVLPYSAVRHLPNLRLSPTGIVPQRNRRPRIIVDYSFYLVNQSTQPAAPDSIQFGHAFNRLLHALQRADTRHGPVYISKTDVADAFMRIWLDAATIPILGAILPAFQREEPLIAFPMILPMGWVESPQYLCSVTETIADLTNDRLAAYDLATKPHRLDALADSTPLPPALPLLPTQQHSLPPPIVASRGPLQKPLNQVDVFMDDFILFSQLPAPRRLKVRRTLFECIDAVLRPRAPSDNPTRKEPNSIKKLLQGDALWSTKKVVLGWLLDTKARTIKLPPHRYARLLELLDSFPPHQRRTSRRKWQCLIGELRSMVLAIPGGRGLFSQLQSILDYSVDAHPSDRLRLTQAVHDQLDDFRWLAKDLSSRPTRWGEVVDSDPLLLGAVDASSTGMGGIWLDPLGKLPPLLWRHPFPSDVTNALVSSSNPQGTLTNSDLEHTGLVCHADIPAQMFDIREATICALTDNTAALSRETRGSTSVAAPSSYLCRLSSLHQRALRYRLQVAYIPGPLNVMADDLSRRWDLSDTQLLSHFNLVYPQELRWHLCHLRSEMHSSAMSALSQQRCNLVFHGAATLPPSHMSVSGPHSVNNMTWTPSCPPSRIQSRGFKSSLLEFEMAGFLPATAVSDLAQWRTRSISWHRRSPSWVIPTPAVPLPPNPLTLACSDS
jgi:hypothetical protein